MKSQRAKFLLHLFLLKLWSGSQMDGSDDSLEGLGGRQTRRGRTINLEIGSENGLTARCKSCAWRDDGKYSGKRPTAVELRKSVDGRSQEKHWHARPALFAVRGITLLLPPVQLR